MAKPTQKDASLMLQLLQVGAGIGLSEAMNWVWSDEFAPDYAEFAEKYPAGSEGSVKAAKICNWFETLGTLYKHGLFNEQLLFDWYAVDRVWDRIEAIPLGWRGLVGDARLYENFEALAKAQKG